MSDQEAFAAYLLANRFISTEQLAEAWHICHQTGAKFDSVLLRLGYADPASIASAKADWLGWPYVDLSEVTVPPAIFELLPESVARENVVLPLKVTGRALWVVLAEPDADTLGKLEFILNREIRPLLSTHEQIVEAINRHYGLSETESVDSMLIEFTDTAIDFTRTDATCSDLPLEFSEPSGSYLDEGIDSGFELVAANNSDAAARYDATTSARPAPRPVSRRATVRYYHRMNPQRMFPLLVILSKEQVREVVRSGVKQAHSQSFSVAEDSFVEVEPILPGCSCFPPRDRLQVKGGEVSATFWVVPEVLGRVMDARVVVSQDGKPLATVPLSMQVVRQSLTRLVGVLSLVMPFGLMLLKHFRLDFESQQEDGFSLYAHLAGLLIRSLTPEVLTILLVSATAGLYLWLRPRRREVFWDIETNEPTAEAPPSVPNELSGSRIPTSARTNGVPNREGDPEEDRLLADLLASDELRSEALTSLVARRVKAGDLPGALALYEKELARGRCGPEVYLRAAGLARRLHDVKRALAYLELARKELTEKEMTGALWFALGCCAARLGRFPEALHALNRAVDGGIDDLKRYEAEADLEPLRWNRQYQGLMRELSQ